jgi:AcrR family transcriptional regulator
VAQIENDPVTRPGIYARGAETVDAILKAALSVLLNEGATAFSIRRVATACGLRVGNVSYHFPRKEMLVQVLLEEIMAHYDAKLEVSVRQPEMSDEERLQLVITICLDDIATKRTTRLFTELWALANHNPLIAERVRAFYGQVHEVIGTYIRPLNPALDDDEVNTLALFISASMEGTTPFLGFEKPWSAKMPAITALSVTWFVHLVKNVKHGEIAQLTSASA